MVNKAWVRIIPAEEGDDTLQRAYAACVDPQTGEPAHILGVQSANPQAMLDHLALYRTLMYGPSPLKRRQREMIALVVSSVNACVY
ncbi:MAG: carboxymuconolactone decarboxylase family protein [Anaerolineaceae bacterium]|nr:carboxymuconolactone decarboxylase family protein [Anaerolineaceae bacterium]